MGDTEKLQQQGGVIANDRERQRGALSCFKLAPTRNQPSAHSLEAGEHPVDLEGLREAACTSGTNTVVGQTVQREVSAILQPQGGAMS